MLATCLVPSVQQAAANQIADKFPGGIDVLINNAGILGAITPATEQYACRAHLPSLTSMLLHDRAAGYTQLATHVLVVMQEVI